MTESERRMTQADFDLEALYEALDERRRSLAMSWAAVARAVNGSDANVHRIAASTITGLATRAVAEGDGVLQMLVWLDRTPESFIAGFADADADRYRLRRVENGGILRWDTPALYSALDAQRQALGMTWKDVAREVGGFTPAGLTGLAKGGRTALPGVMRIVRWLGQPASAFTRISSR